MIKLYLTRHATPDWSRKDLLYHLPPGPPLVEKGQAEAARLGQFLEQHGVRRIYASPLERCLATARLAVDGRGPEIEVAPALMEIQPQESYPEIIARLLPVFDRACQYAARHGPVCLLTHGGPVACLLQHLGMAAATVALWRIYDFHNLLPPAGAWEASQAEAGEPWHLRLAFVP